MLLGEPPPTQADLHFRLFGFPVRISPFFWLIALLIGAGGFSGGPADPVETILKIFVIFVSILVHELGHAFLQRHFGGHPWITLHGLGGLASCEDCDRAPRSQILISLAGPLAGFLLAVAVLLLVTVTGRLPVDNTEATYEMVNEWKRQYESMPIFLSLPMKLWLIEPFDSAVLNTVITSLLWVNIWWGILNLLPIYPLDGGRISREVFTLQGNPRVGIVRSLWLSVATAVAVAVYGLLGESFFMVLMFGYLAFSNYRTIQAYEGQGGAGGW